MSFFSPLIFHQTLIYFDMLAVTLFFHSVRSHSIEIERIIRKNALFQFAMSLIFADAGTIGGLASVSTILEWNFLAFMEWKMCADENLFSYAPQITNAFCFFFFVPTETPFSGNELAIHLYGFPSAFHSIHMQHKRQLK